MPDLDLLKQLESTLTRLAAQGVRFLNLPRNDSLASLLGEHLSIQPPLTEKTSGQAPTTDRQSPGPVAKPEQPVTVSPVQDTAELTENPPPSQGPPPGSSRAAQLVAQLAEQMRTAERGPEGEASTQAKHQPDVPPADSPPEDPATITTLESLLFQFRNCQRCGLSETRNRFVFGTGNSRPRLMFIGEGPGAEEDIQGLPFVGRAGALLTGFILALGLTRDDVYITNVVKCRPPQNRNPEPEETLACRPILLRQIELLKPALIVTLGNVPLKALRPTAGGITRERGHLFTFESTPVLPTFHPSYLLRNTSAIRECWQDFKQAFAIAYQEV